MKKVLKKSGLFAVIFFSILAAMSMIAQAQERRIDRRYPLGGVVQNNCDLIGGCDNYYGYRRYPDLGAVIDLIIRGRRARNQDHEDRNSRRSERERSEVEDDVCDSGECNEEYSRSSRTERSERESYRDEERYESSRSRKVVYRIISITNPYDCLSEVWVNGRRLSYSDGRTLLGPGQRTRIEVPVNRPYRIEIVPID